MGADTSRKGLPLERFTVLDFTRIRSGPTATRQLADWGARVIKIELPPSHGAEEAFIGDRKASDFQNLNRNKESLTLNLKAPEAREILRRLVLKADVVAENYRPDVKTRLGIAYEDLAAINPRLVYGSISGFGQDGPYAKRPGVDQVVQGMSGIMSVTGKPGDGPMRVGAAIGDVTAGILLANGILTALLEREISGKGQWVHTSLLDGLILQMDFQAATWLMDGHVPQQAGNNHPKSIPTGAFKTSDGYINIGAGDQIRWERVAHTIGQPELIQHPDYRTGGDRNRNRDALNAIIEAVTVTNTMAFWVERMNAQGVPCGPIYAVDQVFADPQVRHNGMAAKVPDPERGEVEMVAQPINMSRTQWRMRHTVHDLGADTNALLAEIGYSPQDIADLRARKVV